MPTLRFALASAIALISLASPARADWQFTKWGMSLADVRAAAATADVEVVSTDDRLLIADYPVGSTRFDVRMEFKAVEGLESITLCVNARRPFDSQGVALLRTEVYAAFGSPESIDHRKGFDMALWRDTARNNLVFAQFRVDPAAQPEENGDNCLSYRPLVTRGGF